MLAGSLTAESEQAILNWCATNGLLGILPHRVLQAVFSPQNGSQVQFVRIDVSWTAIERDTADPIAPVLPPRVIVRPLRGVGIAVEPLSMTWVRFFPDVPALERERFVYPESLTDSFSKIYAGPLQDFLSGARALLELLTAIRVRRTPKLRKLHAALTGGLPMVIDSLVAPTGLGAQLMRPERVGLTWVGNSLLASLATMLLEDLSQG